MGLNKKGIDASDATATPQDVAKGKIFYARGGRQVGQGVDDTIKFDIPVQSMQTMSILDYQDLIGTTNIYFDVRKEATILYATGTKRTSDAYKQVNHTLLKPIKLADILYIKVIANTVNPEEITFFINPLIQLNSHGGIVYESELFTNIITACWIILKMDGEYLTKIIMYVGYNDVKMKNSVSFEIKPRGE